MFFGTYFPKLDDKGRLTLPAKFREELAGGLMVTKGQDHCLYVFSKAEFETFVQDTVSRMSSNEAARAYQRHLFSGTDDPELDGQGRISVAPELRRYASLEKECVVIGANNHLEIWDSQAWQRYLDAHEQSYAKGYEEVSPGVA